MELTKVRITSIFAVVAVGLVLSVVIVGGTTPSDDVGGTTPSDDVGGTTPSDDVGDITIIEQLNLERLFNELLGNQDELILASIVDAGVSFIESDNNALTNFLDENNLPFGSAKLLIETAIVLFDSEQNQFPSSSFLGVPQLTLTDDEGKLLDLGTVQIGFFAKLQEQSLTTKITGKVQFFLDDRMVAEKTLIGTSNVDVDTIDLKLTDKVITESTNLFSLITLPTFTFTFADEGANWVHESEHIFRVVLKEITAETTFNQVQKSFLWSGEHVAYELKMTVDEQKLVVIGDDNEAISIFKSDSKVKLCAKGKIIVTAIAFGIIKGTNSSPTPVTPSVTIIVNDEEQGSISKTSGGGTSAPKPPVKISVGNTNCNTFDTVQRDAELKIMVDEIMRCSGAECITQAGQEFIMQTPLSQHNYNLECHAGGGGFKCVCSVATKSCSCPTLPWFIECKSDFGYETKTELGFS